MGQAQTAGSKDAAANNTHMIVKLTLYRRDTNNQPFKGISNIISESLQ